LVVTGNPVRKLLSGAKGSRFLHPEGAQFLERIEASLTAIVSARADAIRKWASNRRIEVKARPRTLAGGDDVNVKKFLFREFDKLGAELLYAVDATGVSGWRGARSDVS